MEPRKLRFLATAVAAAALLLAPAAFAAGSGFTANFNTVNITADTTVNLDGARTIGNLEFGDTNPSSADSWALAAGSGKALTLAGTSPTITAGLLRRRPC